MSNAENGELSISVARGLAAQCWCDERVSDRIMDPELAEVIAEKLKAAYEMDSDFVQMARVLEVA